MPYIKREKNDKDSMLRRVLKKIFQIVGINPSDLIQKISKWSISYSVRENKFVELIERLRQITPDISRQELTAMSGYNDYWELKRRALQAFQCNMMLKALEPLTVKNLTVVDIGDSAGTHMLYLKELTKDKFDIDTIGVNLDPAAIEKIKARGQKAVLCRAEDLNLGDKKVDLFTSFQMVEHLHNPAIFFRRLAKRSPCNKIVLTGPYMKSSRVGLHNIRNKVNKSVIAEEEHIFELDPEDWSLLFLHSGWKVTYSQIYYQYPRKIPIVNTILGWFWRKTDFEGFWGVILEKDTTFSDCYQDWED